MTMPNDPRDPVSDPNFTYPTADQDRAAPSAPPPWESSGRSNKEKASALFAKAAALAGKLREETPKKVHELQEKRAAGRCVIVSEVGGRRVAVGPYPTAELARQALGPQATTASGEVVDLLTPAAYSSATASSAGASTAGTPTASGARLP
jgi:hypothetical protein